MTHYDQLLAQFRTTLANEGDTGMLVAADAFDESDDPAANRFAQLLRKYIEIQTFIRMSSAPPASLVQSYTELNNSFGTKPELRVGSATYSKPFGPLYTGLSVSQSHLMDNLNLLTDHPIRELSVTSVTPDESLAMLLRNYRIEVMHTISLRMFGFQRRDTGNAQKLAGYIKNLKAPMLLRLALTYVEDPNKLIQLNFQMSGVRKGAELWMSEIYYQDAKHVATKRIAPPNMKM